MLYHILLTNVLQFSGVFFKYAKYSSHIYKKIFQYYVGGGILPLSIIHLANGKCVEYILNFN